MNKVNTKLIFSVFLIMTFNVQFGQIKTLTSDVKKSNQEIEKTSLNPTLNPSKEKILNQINSYLDAYEVLHSGFVGDKAFDKVIKPIFAKAVGNTDGIVKNGSVMSYVLDKDKSTISINHAISFEKFGHQLLNININGTSEGSFLNVVNSTKYNYGLEASLKLSKRASASIFYDKENKDELLRMRQRDLYYNLMAKYKQIINTDTSKYNELIKDLEYKISKDYILKDEAHINYKYYKKLNDSLKVMNDSVNVVREFMKMYAKDKLKDDIIDQITTYEKDNAKLNGYTLGWFDYGLTYKLLNNAIFDSTIYTMYKVSQKQFHRFTGLLGYNYFFNGKKSFFYANFGVKVYNGYALENQTLSNINIVDTTGIQEYSFRAYNNLLNKDLNTTYFVTNPFLSLLYFPNNKVFGFEAAAEVKIHDYSAPVYDGRFGIVYSIVDKEDKDKSRTTVGIFLTMTKYDSSIPKTGDYMGIGFRVGLPFNNLFKEPEKK